MIDPFVQPLTEALNSEHVPVLIESLMCMTFLLKFKGNPAACCQFTRLSFLPFCRSRSSKCIIVPLEHCR